MISDPAQYDPKAKQNIKEGLYNLLYEPVIQRYAEQLHHLIVRNTVLGKYSHKSFTYKGKNYVWDDQPLPRKMNRLVPELKGAMDNYLKELQELKEKETTFVMGYINRVLNASSSLADYKLLLPSAVHHSIEKLGAGCPHKTAQLTVEGVQALKSQNQEAFDMMRKRLALNLLY